MIEYYFKFTNIYIVLLWGIRQTIPENHSSCPSLSHLFHLHIFTLSTYWMTSNPQNLTPSRCARPTRDTLYLICNYLNTHHTTIAERQWRVCVHTQPRPQSHQTLTHIATNNNLDKLISLWFSSTASCWLCAQYWRWRGDTFSHINTFRPSSEKA